MKHVLGGLLFTLSFALHGQQWTGSSTLDNELFRNGNVRANSLTFGRYGSSFLGDTNPYSIFTGDNETHDLLLFGNSAATLHFRLYDGDLKLGSSQTPNTILYNNGSASFGASVGIGTASPEAKFTITQIGNGWNDGLRINRDASNYLTLTEDVTDVRLKNWGSGGLLFYTSSTLAAAITNNGNVGIGAAVPEQKLDVRGNLVLEAGTNPILYTGTGSAEQNRFLQLINSTSHGSASGLKAGGVLIADTYAYSNPGKNDLIVKGSVGIGTATPGSYKLAVEGKIGAREVNVTTTAWSDHVFNADYKLRPLTEVQKYIEENHHLPEVPSEKEVLANGQNLGEMNAILLKKIEELTLYQIQLL